MTTQPMDDIERKRHLFALLREALEVSGGERDAWLAQRCAGDEALIVSLYDNLGKGASGAAVQNLNLMLGRPAATGLVPA